MSIMPTTTGSGDIFSSISSAAPTIIKAAGTFFAGKDIEDGNSDAAAKRGEALRQASDYVVQGLDDRQYWTEMGLNDIRNLLTTGYLDQSKQIRGAADTYEDAQVNAVNAFKRAIMPVLSAYGRAQFNNVDEYGRDIDDTVDTTAQILAQGTGAYQDALEPYTDAGAEGLQYTEDLMNLNAGEEVPSDRVGSMGYYDQILATDPSQLTQSQEFAKEDLLRDMLHNLSVSGLRGAGRGGVAAVNEGLARFAADAFDQNRARQDKAAQILSSADLAAYNRNIQRKDAAADVLNRQGFQTTGNIANAYQNLSKVLGDMSYKTGMEKAGTEFQNASDVAGRWYNQGQNISEKTYGGATNAASNSYNAATSLANLTGQHYGNMADVAADRYSARGNTSLSKANSRAGTLDSTSNLDLQTDLANNKVRADTYGRIGGIINNDIKESAKGQTGATKDDTIIIN